MDCVAPGVVAEDKGAVPGWEETSGRGVAGSVLMLGWGRPLGRGAGADDASSAGACVVVGAAGVRVGGTVVLEMNFA